MPNTSRETELSEVARGMELKLNDGRHTENIYRLIRVGKNVIGRWSKLRTYPAITPR
jgi:hypothetical protein